MFKENHAPLWKIEDLLRDSDKAGLVNEPEYSQPLCTAVQIMLVDLLARWGVRPAATIGHSSGKLRDPHPLLVIFLLFFADVLSPQVKLQRHMLLASSPPRPPSQPPTSEEMLLPRSDKMAPCLLWE